MLIGCKTVLTLLKILKLIFFSLNNDGGYALG